jgi:hypothetical protein
MQRIFKNKPNTLKKKPRRIATMASPSLVVGAKTFFAQNLIISV